MRRRPLNQRTIRGQALIETLVVAMYVLIPLLFLGPLVGKYFASTARVEAVANDIAWERTAWLSDRETSLSAAGWDAGTDRLAVRSDAELTQLSLRRRMDQSDRSLPTFAGPSFNTGQAEPSAQRPQWQFTDTKRPLVTLGNAQLPGSAENDRPLSYQVMRRWNTTMDKVFSAFALDNYAEIPHELDGVQKGRLKFQVNPPAAGSKEDWSRELGSAAGAQTGLSSFESNRQAQARVLSRQWSAQDKDNFEELSGALVPTRLINETALGDAFKLIGKVSEAVSFDVDTGDALSLSIPGLASIDLRAKLNYDFAGEIRPFPEELGRVDTSDLPTEPPDCGGDKGFCP